MQMDVIRIRKKLKKKLDEQRYEHTLGVAFTAMSLAMKYDVDLHKAELAGLLHDCAKCMPDERKLHKCEKYKIPISETERKNPSLLHSKLGAYLAEHKYGVKDPEILNAILYHTTGHADMTMLEKIIFVADYIEPRRNKAPNLSKVRKLAFEMMDEAVCKIMKDTLSYLEKKNAVIDDETMHAYEFYASETKKKK